MLNTNAAVMLILNAGQQSDAATGEERIPVMDELAVIGAQDSGLAIEVLIELVHRHRIAYPAITSLLVDVHQPSPVGMRRVGTGWIVIFRSLDEDSHYSRTSYSV